MAARTNTQSFWEHLDMLRATIGKIVAVAVVFGIAAFFFKEQLFNVVLAPKNDGFVTYRNNKRNLPHQVKIPPFLHLCSLPDRNYFQIFNVPRLLKLI